MKQAKNNTMKAVAIDRFGGPETLTLETLPVPEVEPDEVLRGIGYRSRLPRRKVDELLSVLAAQTERWITADDAPQRKWR